MRFTDAPFDNPFRTAQSPAPARDPATTGSIGRVASAPLQPIPAAPSVRAQPLPPPQSAVALSTAPAQPVAGGANGWSAQGGTPVVVAQGESLDMISSRYGVPRAAIMSANGLSSANVAPGSRIVIPVYNGGGAPAPVAAAPAAPARTETQRFVAGPAPARPAASVAEAKTKVQTAADARKAAAEAKAAEAAEAKAKAAADAQAMRESRARFAAEAKAKADARKAGAAAPAAKPVAEAKPTAVQQPARAAAPQPTKPVAVASAPAIEPKPTAIPKAEPEPKTTASLPKPEEESASASDKADFRWPARGRVISGYSKGGNEGINIAVPEGTPVKAAEGGTVAYAGSELKGYGNLVLIRHPNGYVSAYAHNGELKVKRGDTVKRGQVVANSGQTGNVSSPQLHFELRKGSTPVDPTPYLNN
ncbi:peptidoglycan DD-metalloendopeptidase family protein [Bosea thiooxidans]